MLDMYIYILDILDMYIFRLLRSFPCNGSAEDLIMLKALQRLFRSCGRQLESFTPVASTLQSWLASQCQLRLHGSPQNHLLTIINRY